MEKCAQVRAQEAFKGNIVWLLLSIVHSCEQQVLHFPYATTVLLPHTTACNE